MASKVQNASRPGGTTWANLITGTTTPIVVNLSACNDSGSADSAVYIAVIPNGATRSSAHYIEGGVSLASKGVIERTGIVLGNGDKIDVQSASGNVSFIAWGVDLG